MQILQQAASRYNN